MNQEVRSISVKAYTYQIGDGTGDSMPARVHSEAVYADSLGEAIDRP